MAENKKSFILYSDIIYVVNELPDDIAGKLFKIILNYVNDNDPEIDDMLLKIAFEPIKLQLKRDLKKWEKYIDKQQDNGKKGGRPINPNKPKKPNPFIKNPTEPKKADTVNVTVNDTVNVTDIDIEPITIKNGDDEFTYSKEVSRICRSWSQDQVWIEGMCRNIGLKKTADLKFLILAFIHECELTNQLTGRIESDLKHHCLKWCKIELEKNPEKFDSTKKNKGIW